MALSEAHKKAGSGHQTRPSWSFLARRAFRARESNCRLHRICGSPATGNLLNVYAIEDCVGRVGFTEVVTL
jgi:hypothetical protein